MTTVSYCCFSFEFNRVSSSRLNCQEVKQSLNLLLKPDFPFLNDFFLMIYIIIESFYF